MLDYVVVPRTRSGCGAQRLEHSKGKRSLSGNVVIANRSVGTEILIPDTQQDETEHRRVIVYRTDTSGGAGGEKWGRLSRKRRETSTANARWTGGW